MIVAIHQPNFFPWLGYFYKMAQCQHFVWLDDVQFVRRGFTSRVNIKTTQGAQWLTVPVKKKGRYFQGVKEVEIEPDTPWKPKILGTLKSSYSRTPFFKTYYPAVEHIIMTDYLFLVDLNMASIHWVAQELEINTPVTRSSQLSGINGLSGERLVSICQALGAHQYLSGFGGQNYQEQELFQAAGIQLQVYGFKHPQYPQPWGAFVAGLSTLDLLFNCGPDSAGILKKIFKNETQQRENDQETTP